MLLFCGGDGLFFWWEIRVGEIKKRAESGEDSLQKERKKERKKRLKIKYGRRSIRRARVENTREKKADSLSTSFLWDQGEANGTCSRAPFPIIFSLYF